MMLKGKIISGLKKAAFFVELEWVQEQCDTKLGFKPFPGTLNLQLLSEYVPVIEEIYKRDGIELTSPDPSFCSGKVMPAKVEGVPAAIMIPGKEVRVHGKNIIEVIAPERLKDTLGVKEGDLVSLHVYFHHTQKIEKRLSVDAVIFDLDGTLIDSTEIYFKILETVFDNLGIPQISRGDVLSAVKDGDFRWEDILPKDVKVRKEDVISESLKIRDEFYLKKFNTEVGLVRKADDMLKQISSSSMKLALVTSTSRQDLVYKLYSLKRAGVDNLFEVIITTDDAQNKKPAADPLVECGRRLGVPMKRSVYIGDACIDIKAGKAAGMKTIAVLTGFDNYETLKKENPDFIINSVRELGDVIVF